MGLGFAFAAAKSGLPDLMTVGLLVKFVAVARGCGADAKAEVWAGAPKVEVGCAGAPKADDGCVGAPKAEVG